QELLGGGMTTFTVGFADAESELAEAAQTAREIGSTHYSLEITSQQLGENLGRVAWHLDEPVGDPAAFAVLAVCELARQHVKVLLSGEGADELFGGYEDRYAGMLATMGRTERLRRARKLTGGKWFLSSFASRSRWTRMRARANSNPASELATLRIEGFPGDVTDPRGLTEEQIGKI